jgi:nucleotide-binding universal stress UspA family protein
LVDAGRYNIFKFKNIKSKYNLNEEKTRFSNIIVTVDGSESSLSAADFAISLASRDSSQLTILTVIHTAVGFGHSGKPEEWHQSERIRAQELFDKIIKNAQNKNVICKTDIIETHMSVDGAIVNYAEEQKGDLIVIGTSGMTGLKKMLLGSVLTGVVRYATCPVLVVK